MIQIPSHIPEKKKKEKSIFDRSSVLCLWSFNLNAESNIQSRYESICVHFCLCIDTIWEVNQVVSLYHMIQNILSHNQLVIVF